MSDPQSDARPVDGKVPSKLLSKRILYQGKVLDLAVERVLLPNGEETDLEVVRHAGAAAVVPLLEDGRVVLVRQFRHATGGWLLEIPAGKLDRGEEPETCARRELTEETGYRLTPGGELVELGWIWSSPGFADERIWLYLARGLEMHRTDREADEVLEVETLPLEDLRRRLARGQIHDAKTVSALLLALQRLDN